MVKWDSMSSNSDKMNKPQKLGKRCYVSEYVVPSVRWLEGAICPRCGSIDLMDADGMALCVKCNKFVKPTKA